MGEVYLAEHVHMGRKAAIKVLLPELSSKADVVARFFNEARATGLLKHPGIVEILDCDVHPSGRAYIVMEYLPGESLGEYLGRVGSFEKCPAVGAAIAGQIAGALAVAHEKGIIHRDLKPDNVLLTPAAGGGTPTRVTVKILDFGIAKLVGDDTGTMRQTRTGSLLGTPLYMSPEQCRGAGRVDHRTDIYSLGCILFESMAGRPPFIREGVGDLIVAHVSQQPAELAELIPSVSPVLSQLVKRMLAKDPAQRPPSMVDVVAEIAGFLGVPPAGFSAVIPLPENLPIRIAGARALTTSVTTAHRSEGGGRTQAMASSGATTAIASASGRTQVLAESATSGAGASSRAQTLVARAEAEAESDGHADLDADADADADGEADGDGGGDGDAVPDSPAPRRSSFGPGRAVALLVVAAIVGGGVFLSIQRWGSGFSTGQPPSRERETTGTRQTRPPERPPDPADLAAIAPFLQTGLEPAFPDSCRTHDGESTHALALAAQDLAPGASAAQRARGLAGLAAVPETSTERWMIAARATLAADAQRAEPASARAVSLCAASAVAQNLRGNTLQMLQQIAPAEAAYAEAARLAPTYLAPRFNLGLLRLRSDDARAALAIFDQVLRANPDYPNIHLVRADAYRRLGDRTQATAELDQQVKSQPENGDGWLQLGRALQAHDSPRANEAFCRAKALGQSDAVALCSR